MNLLFAFLAFNIIVIVHELGHFIAAKKSGIKVLEFSLFIGPKIFSIQRGETTYTLRLIPVIAYVKMEGEEEESDDERSFNKKPLLIRALTVFAGPLANLILAVVLLTVLFSLQGFTTTAVSKVADQSPAAEAGIMPGDRILSYDGKRVLMPLDLMQFLYISKGAPTEIEFLRDGEKYREIIKPKIIPATSSAKIGVSLGADGSGDTNVIKALSPGMPAKNAGLMVGDRIVKLNGMDVKSADEIIELVTKNGTKPISVVVMRGTEKVAANLTPVEVKTEEGYDLGLAFEYRKGGFFEALRESAVFTCSITRSTALSIGWLITGKAKLSQTMGPIGMVSTISTAVEQAPSLIDMLMDLIYLMALFSIALGATNLIPFPMLDGGKLVFLGLEAIRGKPISQEKEGYISIIGLILILTLAAYVAYNDIVRIIAG